MVHIFGPGGHSNLAAQEIFFRAGGLMHVSAILDEGTLLSNGCITLHVNRANPRIWSCCYTRSAFGQVGVGVLLWRFHAYTLALPAKIFTRSPDRLWQYSLDDNILDWRTKWSTPNTRPPATKTLNKS